MAFSATARTVHAYDRASCPHVPASPVLAFFLPPLRCPNPRMGERGGEERMPCLGERFLPRLAPGDGHRVGRRLERTEQCARTTVYPCDARHGRQHPLPCTHPAYWTPNPESTHRTNGALDASPGGRTATLSDWLLPASSSAPSLTLHARIVRLTPPRPPAWRDAEPSSSR